MKIETLARHPSFRENIRMAPARFPWPTPAPGPRTYMLDGPSIVAALKECGITHVIWIPDSDLGTWDAALSSAEGLSLIRVCREGEAFALAAGLHLGGRRPIILIQCTGLFEAGDALRNVIHDLNLPLFFVVGVRNYYSHQQGATPDTCPVFAQPIMQAWKVPFVILDNRHSAQDLADAFRQAQAEKRAGCVLLAE
ncbi:MAG: hypothetical protein HYX68_04165 [Planctomycetes bacterium]|jgi:sulfopyruvate decarboxylase TPP-binding subunit|nr:hypothetical protein [Planctomycetota bacterium]